MYFRQPIIGTPQNVITFTKAAIVLHNFLCINESSVYCPPGFTDAEDGVGNILQGEWRSQVSEDSGLSRLGQVGGNKYFQSAAEVRDIYRDYFQSPEGELSWQYNYVHRTS